MTKKRILIASAIIAGVLVAGAAGYYFTVYKKNAEANKVYDIIMSTAGAGGASAEGKAEEGAASHPTKISEPRKADDICRMVFLGDSIVYEMADRVPDFLPIRGYNFSVVNAAAPGGGLFHKTILPDMPEKIMPGDYVVISVGANDVLEKEAEIKSGEYAKSYQAFIDDVVARGGKPILLSYFGTDNEFFTKDQMEIIMDDINPMIKKAGRKLDAPVINTEPAERQDGVHLTELGMRFVLGVLINEHDYYFDSRCQYKSAQANPPSQH